MITLIGTGHVFNLSPMLLSLFDEKQPDCLCVELDIQRYQGIMIKRTNPEAYKNASKQLPAIYKILARFQENMANEYGVQPGDEMMTTIDYAQTHQLPLEFIDMNTQHVFITMWKTMPIREKLKLFLSGFGGLFINKKRLEHELKNVQNDFDSYLQEIGKQFPTIKKTLIDERNTYMTQRLLHLHTKHTNIIAIVGDGHIPGIIALLKENHIDVNVIRLQELQQLRTQNTDGSSAHFSIGYKQT